MKVGKASTGGPCDAIEAEFVYGPQRCLRWTEWQTEDDGELFYVCDEHITAQREAEATR